MKQNSAAMDAIAEFVNVMNHTGLCALNFPGATHQIYLYSLEHSLEIHSFKPTRLPDC